MAERFLCIHGHFYQPPREDPFTGVIPQEPGAFPYPNWNERIHAECYRPNVELGNFKRISFNLGPTLFDWLLRDHPETAQMIAQQDQENVRKFGVGNAMAQAYNHTILPLATWADKVTQIYWGIAHFNHYMGRKPQGMWLPETAVDMETLEVLVELGIEFTILAPSQADEDDLDVSEPYDVMLPEDRRITAFFFQRELSTGVSFNPNLTQNADTYIKEQVSVKFQQPGMSKQSGPRMLMIASDGELYGHHQRFRDHFLARLLNGASEQAGISVIYPALWLDKYSPRSTVKIKENTSWSCHHHIMRWMGDCECTPDDGRWKVYFRQAMNHLASEIDMLFSDELWSLGLNPWKVRNGYIYVILEKMTVSTLLEEMGNRTLTADEIHRVALLLRSQYERQRMFTSCGWFFDDFGRIEPRNNLAYAVRAVWLARSATGIDLSHKFKADLQHVVSHKTGLRADIVFDYYWQIAEGMQPESLHLSAL
jgi:hypothetical protein